MKLARIGSLAAVAGIISITGACVSVCGETPQSKTAIKVDQVGYLPNAPKLAMVVPDPQIPQPPATFSIRRVKDDSVAFTGELTRPVQDRDSGDAVQIADFSKLTESGRFYIDIAGVGQSWKFTIAPNVFNRIYYLAMRAYYGQRCGTAVDLGPEFPGLKHGPCHLVGAYHPSSGKEGPHVSSKGWHDAGDYGRYVVNSGISTGTLLWTWELFGDRVGKIGLRLPESGNRLPDILNEIRWNLDWMLTMQDTDGGVWHKQTSDHFCAFIMPEQDTLVSDVIGTGKTPYKSSCATADFAAVMAIAARVYKPFERAYAEKCLMAAKLAWAWVNRHPNVVFHNPPGVTTGDYGDPNCGDEHLWAAAELARTTGQAEYVDYFLAHYAEYLDIIRPVGPPSWSSVGPLALWSYALGHGGNAAAQQAIRQRSLAAADAIVERTAHNPYRIALTTKDYIWGSNGVAANYSMQLLIANRISPNPRYLEAAMENVHYLLGRNTFSLSWLTQVGENSVKHPHHRPSEADGIAAPYPGLLAGGPNPGRQDAYMKRLLPAGLPPAKNYIDETGAYACNEVAINWNAPLVFTLASMAAE